MADVKWIEVLKYLEYPEALKSFLGPDSLHDPKLLVGLFSSCSHSWVAYGPKLVILNNANGSITSSWSFGTYFKSLEPEIVCVKELSEGNSSPPYLLVGINFIGSGMFCIYHPFSTRILRAVKLDEEIGDLAVIDDGTPEISPLPKALASLEGTIAIGERDGSIVIADLARQSIDRALAGDFDVIKGETDPASLVFIDCVLDNATTLNNKKELCSIKGNSLAILLNDGMHGLIIPEFGIGITTVHYCSQAASLFVGYTSGSWQMWSISNFTLMYTCMKPRDSLPVHSFCILEPCDDPKATLYCWVGHHSRPPYLPPHVFLYTLNFETSEEVLDDNKSTRYQDFLQCSLSFEMSLNLQNKAEGRMISCSSVSRSLPRTLHHCIGYPETETTPLRIFTAVWDSWNPETENRVTMATIFDLNQWYREQMPNAGWINAPFLLELKVFSGGNTLVTGFPSHSFSIYTSPQPLEQHFYPSALSFDCVVLQDNGLMMGRRLGQQAGWFKLVRGSGPSTLHRPSSLYNACVAASLAPILQQADLPELSSPTEEEQRSFVLTVCLENRMNEVILQCAKLWCDGSRAVAGCSLSHLLSWLWNALCTYKRAADRLCVPLFDRSGVDFDINSRRRLQYYRTAIHTITTVYAAIIKEHAYYIMLQDVEEKSQAMQLILMYLNMVCWFLSSGILPEKNSKGEPSSSIPYHYEKLLSFCTERRAELQKLNKGDENLFLIDNICSGEGVKTNLTYPPTSLQNLIRITLNVALTERIKQAVILYFLMDFVEILSYDKSPSTVDSIERFKMSFGIPESHSKIVQAFWNLDHCYFEDGVKFLLDRSVFSYDLTSWQHRSILKLLVNQSKHKLALSYLQGKRPPLTLPDDIRFKMSLFLSNSLTHQAFMFQREHKHLQESLLKQFFRGCMQNKTLKIVCNLPLDKYEERVFVEFLNTNNLRHSDDLQIIYLLTRSRYLEAIDLNEKLNLKVKTNAMGEPVAPYREQSSTRNLIVKGITNTISEVSRHLSSFPNLKGNKNSSFMGKKLEPLSRQLRFQEDRGLANIKEGAKELACRAAIHTSRLWSALVQDSQRHPEKRQFEEGVLMDEDGPTTKKRRLSESTGAGLPKTPPCRTPVAASPGGARTTPRPLDLARVEELARTPVVEPLRRERDPTTSPLSSKPHSILKMRPESRIREPYMLRKRTPPSAKAGTGGEAPAGDMTPSKTLRFTLPKEEDTPPKGEVEETEEAEEALTTPTRSYRVSGRKSIHEFESGVKFNSTEVFTGENIAKITPRRRSRVSFNNMGNKNEKEKDEEEEECLREEEKNDEVALEEDTSKKAYISEYSFRTVLKDLLAKQRELNQEPEVEEKIEDDVKENLMKETERKLPPVENPIEYEESSEEIVAKSISRRKQLLEVRHERSEEKVIEIPAVCTEIATSFVEDKEELKEVIQEEKDQEIISDLEKENLEETSPEKFEYDVAESDRTGEIDNLKETNMYMEVDFTEEEREQERLEDVLYGDLDVRVGEEFERETGQQSMGLILGEAFSLNTEKLGGLGEKEEEVESRPGEEITSEGDEEEWRDLAEEDTSEEKPEGESDSDVICLDSDSGDKNEVDEDEGKSSEGSESSIKESGSGKDKMAYYHNKYRNRTARLNSSSNSEEEITYCNSEEEEKADYDEEEELEEEQDLEEEEEEEEEGDDIYQEDYEDPFEGVNEATDDQKVVLDGEQETVIIAGNVEIDQKDESVIIEETSYAYGVEAIGEEGCKSTVSDKSVSSEKEESFIEDNEGEEALNAVVSKEYIAMVIGSDVYMGEDIEPIIDAVKEPLKEKVKDVLEEPMEKPLKKLVKEPPKQSMAEPLEEMVEEPFKESMKEPLKEPMEEPLKELMKEPLKKIVNEPLKKPMKEPLKKMVEEPLKKMVEQPLKKIVEEALKKTVEQPPKKTVEELLKKTVEQPLKKMVEEPLKKTVGQPVKKMVEEPLKKRVGPPLEKDEEPLKETVEQPLKKMVEEPLKKTEEQPDKKIVEEPLKKTVEQSLKKMVEEEPLKKTVEQPLKKMVEEPLKKTVGPSLKKDEEPLKETVEQPLKKMVEEPLKKTEEQPVKKIVEKPLKKTVEQPLKKMVEEEPFKKTVEQPLKKMVEEEPLKKMVEEPLKKLAEQPVKKMVEESLKKPAEQPVKKMVEEPLKKMMKEHQKEMMEEYPTKTMKESLIEEVKEQSLLQTGKEPQVAQEQTSREPEPLLETIKEPTKTVKKCLKEPIREPFVESVKKSLKEPISEHLIEIVKDPSRKSVKRPLSKEVKESVIETLEEPTATTVKEPTKSMEELIGKIIEGPISEVLEEPKTSVKPHVEKVKEPITNEERELLGIHKMEVNDEVISNVPGKTMCIKKSKWVKPDEPFTAASNEDRDSVTVEEAGEDKLRKEVESEETTAGKVEKTEEDIQEKQKVVSLKRGDDKDVTESEEVLIRKKEMDSAESRGIVTRKSIGSGESKDLKIKKTPVRKIMSEIEEKKIGGKVNLSETEGKVQESNVVTNIQVENVEKCGEEKVMDVVETEESKGNVSREKGKVMTPVHAKCLDTNRIYHLKGAEESTGEALCISKGSQERYSMLVDSWEHSPDKTLGATPDNSLDTAMILSDVSDPTLDRSADTGFIYMPGDCVVGTNFDELFAEAASGAKKFVDRSIMTEGKKKEAATTQRSEEVRGILKNREDIQVLKPKMVDRSMLTVKRGLDETLSDGDEIVLRVPEGLWEPGEKRRDREERRRCRSLQPEEEYYYRHEPRGVTSMEKKGRKRGDSKRKYSSTSSSEEDEDDVRLGEGTKRYRKKPSETGSASHSLKEQDRRREYRSKSMQPETIKPKGILKWSSLSELRDRYGKVTDEKCTHSSYSDSDGEHDPHSGRTFPERQSLGRSKQRVGRKKSKGRDKVKADHRENKKDVVVRRKLYDSVVSKEKEKRHSLRSKVEVRRQRRSERHQSRLEEDKDRAEKTEVSSRLRAKSEEPPKDPRPARKSSFRPNLHSIREVPDAEDVRTAPDKRKPDRAATRRKEFWTDEKETKWRNKLFGGDDEKKKDEESEKKRQEKEPARKRTLSDGPKLWGLPVGKKHWEELDLVSSSSGDEGSRVLRSGKAIRVTPSCSPAKSIVSTSTEETPSRRRGKRSLRRAVTTEDEEEGERRRGDGASVTSESSGFVLRSGRTLEETPPPQKKTPRRSTRLDDSASDRSSVKGYRREGKVLPREEQPITPEPSLSEEYVLNRRLTRNQKQLLDRSRSSLTPQKPETKRYFLRPKKVSMRIRKKENQ